MDDEERLAGGEGGVPDTTVHEEGGGKGEVVLDRKPRRRTIIHQSFLGNVSPPSR